ncbi:MAG: hypothetical protein EP329_08605 [Deltaproteobacteria bacterium]|nr:MAG: hypothetical protein EP329_08605 [Deltaproteobacteria bacterium]
MPETVMTPLEAVLWYLSLPVLYYVAYRFVWINLRRWESLNPAPPADAPPAPEPDPPAAS